MICNTLKNIFNPHQFSYPLNGRYHYFTQLTIASKLEKPQTNMLDVVGVVQGKPLNELEKMMF